MSQSAIRYDLLHSRTSRVYALIYQALLVADNVTFTNCLVVMRPKTTKEDLPSRATVRTYLQNSFATFMDEVRSAIRRAIGDVLTNFDLWTEEHANIAFFGLTGQWIDITEPGIWRFRAEVLAMHQVLGTHSGANLGKYFTKFCDRAGITHKTEENKVRTSTCMSLAPSL